MKQFYSHKDVFKKKKSLQICCSSCLSMLDSFSPNQLSFLCVSVGRRSMATGSSRLTSLQFVGPTRKRKLSQHPYMKSQRRALIGPDWVMCQSWTNHWGLGYYDWWGLDLLPNPGAGEQDTVIGSSIRATQKETGEASQRRGYWKHKNNNIRNRELSKQRESHVQTYTTAMECA